MKRSSAAAIIIVYLFLTLIMENYHNHPVTQGETDDCPAYILGLNFISETPVDFCASLEYLFFGNDFLEEYQRPFSSQRTSLHFDHRAPPQNNSIY